MESRGTLPRLRTSLDSNDTFLNGGHGIIRTAGATRHAERMKNVPVWALDDSKIAEFIKSRFPGSKTDPDQRKRASRTIRLIHLYYRVGATSGMIAEEFGISVVAVRQAVWRLERAMKRPLKPSHRQKQNPVTIEASSGTSGDDSHYPSEF